MRWLCDENPKINFRAQRWGVDQSELAATPPLRLPILARLLSLRQTKALFYKRLRAMCTSPQTNIDSQQGLLWTLSSRETEREACHTPPPVPRVPPLPETFQFSGRQSCETPVLRSSPAMAPLTDAVPDAVRTHSPQPSFGDVLQDRPAFI
ncbi:hypothetical protein AAFF_G00057120 [Aldrovandia affinis]|uniref:Uncharacterized protein n=1 Tax=Aldrovandia affinis TaxID=143900 RepID=A0AAD7S0N9_9TELE|nr:hypothetical protein AAFF_G00057120 [Aldrovandia affinis]